MDEDECLEFFCPYCGVNTRIKKALDPMGKQKKCKGCGRIFDLATYTLKKEQPKPGQEKVEEEKKPGKSKMFTTFFCMKCGQNYSVLDSSCPYCKSRQESDEASRRPVKKEIRKLIELLQKSAGEDDVVATRAIVLFGKEAVDALPVLAEKVTTNHLLGYRVIEEFLKNCGSTGVIKFTECVLDSLRKQENPDMAVWELLPAIERCADQGVYEHEALAKLDELSSLISDMRRSRKFPVSGTPPGPQKKIDDSTLKLLENSQENLERILVSIKVHQKASPHVASSTSEGAKIVDLLRQNTYRKAVALCKAHQSPHDTDYSSRVVDTIAKAYGIPIKKTACFIATAACGSPDCREVKLLQQYRDEKLLGSPWGRLVVAIYYRISPALAASLEKRPFLKKIARKWLVLPVVIFLEKRGRGRH